MDFLDIRKKAKERAQARAAAESEAQADVARAQGQPDPLPSPAPRGDGDPGTREAAPPAPIDAPVVTEQDVLEGALAARLQGLPAVPAADHLPAAGDDPRFTTWRPGTDARPVPPDPEPPPLFEPDPADFAVVAPEAKAPALSGGASGPARPPRAAPLPTPAPATIAPPAPVDPLDEFFYREGEEGPALPEIASAPEPEPERVILAREEFLTFLLGAEEYAVAIERVREVVRAPPITEVPRAPAHILGVVTVRGEVVAVVDPRRRLGLPHECPAEGEGKVVIVDAGDGPCGLHVDRVASVVRLRPGSIEPCPQGIAGQRAEFLAGIGRDGDRLFTVLDLGALLRRGPAREVRAGRADAGR